MTGMEWVGIFASVAILAVTVATVALLLFRGGARGDELTQEEKDAEQVAALRSERDA